MNFVMNHTSGAESIACPRTPPVLSTNLYVSYIRINHHHHITFSLGIILELLYSVQESGDHVVQLVQGLKRVFAHVTDSALQRLRTSRSQLQNKDAQLLMG